MTTLVLLPGLDGTGALFQPILRELPVEWRKVVVSYPMDAEADYEALVRHAAQCLPAGERLVLLGESFSGPVAIKLASLLGTQLQALILCCTFVCSPRPALWSLRSLLGWLPAPRSVPAVLSARVLLGRGAPSDVRALLASVLERLPASVARARLRMAMTIDARDELSRLSAPVLYLQAGQDRLVPATAAAHVQACCPAALVVRLNGPHGLLQSQPGLAAATMTSFLACPA